MKKIKTESVFVIIIAIFLVVTLSVITFINYRQSRSNKAYLNKPLILPKQEITAKPVFPTQTIPFKSSPNREINKDESLYNTSSLDKLIEKTKNRLQLSEIDQMAKQAALSVLPVGETSGILYKSSDVIIDYTFGQSDSWQVEILTTDINKAKSEALVWFRNKGFSPNFICDYPVGFYLNYEVKQLLVNSTNTEQFNALAPGCD